MIIVSNDNRIFLQMFAKSDVVAKKLIYLTYFADPGVYMTTKSNSPSKIFFKYVVPRKMAAFSETPFPENAYLFKVNNRNTVQGVKYVQSQQQRYQNYVNKDTRTISMTSFCCLYCQL